MTIDNKRDIMNTIKERINISYTIRKEKRDKEVQADESLTIFHQYEVVEHGLPARMTFHTK